MKRMLAVCVGIATCCAAETVWAASPDGQVVGRWHGTIENFGATEDHGRDLIIAADGTCRWGLTGKAGKADCDYGPTITIRTGAAPPSTVRLSLSDGKLVGGFTPANTKKMFQLTMTKVGAK